LDDDALDELAGYLAFGLRDLLLLVALAGSFVLDVAVRKVDRLAAGELQNSS
jgi:hypothetical protein